jgi:hypothetical protein
LKQDKAKATVSKKAELPSQRIKMNSSDSSSDEKRKEGEEVKQIIAG